MSAPRATYRLQFGEGFGFAEAAGLAGYLADLGVSHVYLAPIFTARAGSTHGYDGVNHNEISPALGGEAGFRAMAAAFRAEGLGLILDFVPNHMGVGPENRFWQSVLAEGPASPYADWFDIDWESDYPGLRGKVLMPVLGVSYGEALETDVFELRVGEGEAAIWAHGAHRLPLRPEDASALLASPGAAERYREPAALDALIERQFWRAAKFDLDGEAINYRRFFTVSELAGLRVEEPEVFDAVHGLVLALLAEGMIDGIRIDHIDGLADPAGYCARLRAAAGRPFYLLVEKILAPDERLPDWDTDGTTGYEFGNLVTGLLGDPAGVEALTEGYARFIGRREDPEAMVREAKREILGQRMASEMEVLVTAAHRLANREGSTRDIPRGGLRAVLREVIAALGVYRTYAAGGVIGAGDAARITEAVAEARVAAASWGPAAPDFVEAALTGRVPGADDFIRRFQQLSGPVMAKGLEDTALYRFNRLIALNEVGSKPGLYAVDLAEFHAANADRLAREPDAMLASSTHDTKRGEDARARILAVSEDPAAWTATVEEWHGLLAPESNAVERQDAYFFYQLLLGVWPMEWRDAPPEADLDALKGRVTEAMLKSVREAGVRARWVHGDEGYEAAIRALVERALGDARFLAAFRGYEAGIAAAGARNAMIGTALRLTVPGVPDIYQGAEFWEQSLVDPDNRRPVDFARRAAVLAGGGAAAEGAGKLGLITRLLRFRAEWPDLFARGAYEPLGAGDDRVLAFARRGGGAELVVIARLAGARGEARGADVAAALAGGGWRDLAAGEGESPVAVLARVTAG